MAPTLNILLLGIELNGRLVQLNAKYRFIWRSFNKKMWKRACHQIFSLDLMRQIRPWWWFNGAISNVSNLIDVSLQSLAGNLITKVSDKFSPKSLWLTRPKEILLVNCLLFCPWSTMILLLLFSPSALNWIAHSDLKMLFTIESYTYLSKCQMCSQVAKSYLSVET